MQKVQCFARCGIPQHMVRSCTASLFTLNCCVLKIGCVPSKVWARHELLFSLKEDFPRGYIRHEFNINSSTASGAITTSVLLYYELLSAKFNDVRLVNYWVENHWTGHYEHCNICHIRHRSHQGRDCNLTFRLRVPTQDCAWGFCHSTRFISAQLLDNKDCASGHLVRYPLHSFVCPTFRWR